MNFNDFGFRDALNSGLRDIGFESPTPIQEKSIPIILEGSDMIGAAQTGTGKTGAFVIPLLQKILENPSEHTQALILSPTRELAQQIDEQIFALGYHTGISSATIIGGEDFAKQANAIRSGVDVIVATPGRLIDQTKVLDIDFGHIKYLVLDEGDRMLDMGFLPDVNKIISKLPTERQTMFFSATFPDEIKKLADSIMRNPKRVEIEISKPAESVEQKAYLVHPKARLSLVEKILEEMDWESCIIFTATKKGTDELERILTKRGINAGSIHGDRSQDERNKALMDFKNGTVPVIVATDVLARGIDIDDISLIINYDVPRAVEDYIHRIGRTGRYDKSGVAVTFVTRKDQRFLDNIKKKVGDQLSIEKYDDRKDNSPEKKSRRTPEKSGSGNENNKSSNDSSKRRRKEVPDNEKRSEREKRPERKSEAKRPEDDKRSKDRNDRNHRKESDRSSNDDRTRRTGRSGDSRRKESADSNTIVAERIPKATSRNKKKSTPSKGVWGLIKSLLPRF
ncbi:DEAD/DEAH box helicase [Balneola sp. MJW-20]|uniref:DEAD/DEAH box helicase n=1 Tax=Gracilimonas aurantiaca TaxID=3234185 RepID=UPI0034665095